MAAYRPWPLWGLMMTSARRCSMPPSPLRWFTAACCRSSATAFSAASALSHCSGELRCRRLRRMHARRVAESAAPPSASPLHAWQRVLCAWDGDPVCEALRAVAHLTGCAALLPSRVQDQTRTESSPSNMAPTRSPALTCG